MSSPVLILCLSNLAVIGSLPRIFFRRGRLNLDWWVTAAPFLATAGLLLAGIVGVAHPFLTAPPFFQSIAVILSAASFFLIGLTLGTHREPLSLWHQENDTPTGLVVHGAYALVRHPFYSAFLVALLAAGLAFPHPITGTAFAFACIRLNLTAAREEKNLLDSSFGPSYDVYRRTTGRFIPFAPPAGRMAGRHHL